MARQGCASVTVTSPVRLGLSLRGNHSNHWHSVSVTPVTLEGKPLSLTLALLLLFGVVGKLLSWMGAKGSRKGGYAQYHP